MKLLTLNEKITVALLLGDGERKCEKCQGTGNQFTPWSYMPCHHCYSTGRDMKTDTMERIKEIEANG